MKMNHFIKASPHKNSQLISYAVALALGASLAPQLAQADDESDLLFPYVVKDANRTTVITVITPDVGGIADQMHIQYWTKSTTAANTAACEPSSSTMVTTENDVVTFDTAGLFGTPTVPALFGDTTNAAPLGASISFAGPRHGYLVIAFDDNETDSNSDADNNVGYWVEVDFANGGAHGDIAYDSDDNDNGDFSDQDGHTVLQNTTIGGSITKDPERPVVFWPTSLVSTAFTVTPLGTVMENSDNNTVVLQVFNTSGQQGAYDRNENGIDGTVPQTVRCVGRLTPAQLMPGVVINAAWAAQGGWGWLVNLGDGDTNSESNTIDLDAAVYQVDTSNAAGSGRFMSNAWRIVSDDD